MTLTFGTNVNNLAAMTIPNSANRRQPAARIWRMAFLVLLTLGAPLSPEARSLRFRHLTAEDGLSKSLVRALLQDSRGFMWLGTAKGLNRYDGYRFQI